MLDLIKAISLGLVVLLPLANPLTTVALFLGLAGNMNSAERNHQSMMASVYVFAIMMVAYYAGQVVMNTFGISIPGLRIAGGLIVAFIGFRMLFPAQKAHESPEATSKSEELETEPSANIAFVPIAMPSTAGPVPATKATDPTVSHTANTQPKRSTLFMRSDRQVALNHLRANNPDSVKKSGMRKVAIKVLRSCHPWVWKPATGSQRALW